MPAFRFDRLRRPSLSLALMCSLLGGTSTVRAQGVTPPPSIMPPARGLAASRDAQTQLRFLRKEWSEVLQKVAQDTNSTLEMSEVPTGTFTRSDFASYSREEAINLLNRELVKQGFRLTGEGDVLRLTKITRERIDYAPVMLNQNRPDANPNPSLAELREIAREQKVRAAEQRVRQPIQQAGFEQAAPEVAPVPKAESLPIQPQHRPAMDIAKSLRVTFNQRARLENTGPNGFPAFVVDHFDPEAENQKLFTLEIDQEENRVLVTADREVRNALRDVIHAIDLNPLTMEQAPALLSGKPHAARFTQDLVLPLRQMMQARGVPGGNQPVQLAQQNALQPQVQPQPNVQPPADNIDVLRAPAEALPALIANLRADVTIEPIPALNIIIVRGREEDVAQVRQIIAAIERLAAGNAPKTNIVPLQHVDSQSMATLLSTVFQGVGAVGNQTGTGILDSSVQIIPVVTPNSLIVIANEGTHAAVMDLVTKLDHPVDPASEVRIFRPANGIPSQMLIQLQTMYFAPTQQQAGTPTVFQGAADDRTNTIIIQAAPRNMEKIWQILTEIDAGTSRAVNLLKVIRIQNATASEMAVNLNTLFQSVLTIPPPPVPPSTTGQLGGGQFAGQGINLTPQAVVLQLLSENRDELLTSGLLYNIRFNADVRSNNLMVTAPEASMPLIVEVVRILDQPAGTIAQVKVYTLNNADAVDVQTLLLELFAPVQAAAGGVAAQQNTQPFSVAPGSGTELVPLRVSIDARTNSVMVVGTPQLQEIVNALIFRLDQDTISRREYFTRRLRNASAQAVADALVTFFQGRLTILNLAPNRLTEGQLLDQEIIVTPELTTNNLLISTTPNYRDQVLELIDRLDADPLQVLISALIVEVELNNTDEFGVELGLQDRVLFKRSTAAGVPGFLFNNAPLGNNVNAAQANPSDIGTQGLSTFALGRTNTDLGYGGLVLSASSESVSVLIRALAARRNVRVLSRPQVRALDNYQAYIQVGQVVPVVNGATITQGIVNPTIIRDPAGIILLVTPKISNDGFIFMEVGAEKSAYTGAGVPVFTDVTTGTVITSPIKDIITAVSRIRVQDGQTVVVGGMITKRSTDEERGVPWFKDLPWVGPAFRFDSHDELRTELLIFLTPRMVRNEGDSEMINRVEMGRTHAFTDDAEAIHGPIFAATPEMAMPLNMYPAGAPGALFPPGGEIPLDPNLDPQLNPQPNLPPQQFNPPVPMLDQNIVPEPQQLPPAAPVGQNGQVRPLTPVSHTTVEWMK